MDFYFSFPFVFGLLFNRGHNFDFFHFFFQIWIDFYAPARWGKLTFKVEYSLKLDVLFFRRRCTDLSEKGILYVGSGVSGGEEGARYGPSIMPGGNPEAWPHIKPIFQVLLKFWHYLEYLGYIDLIKSGIFGVWGYFEKRVPGMAHPCPEAIQKPGPISNPSFRYILNPLILILEYQTRVAFT